MQLPRVTPPDTRGWLALASVGQATCALVLLALVPIPAANHDLFSVLVAQAIVVGFAGVYGYYFGTSKGAADVRVQLGQALAKVPDAVAAAPPTGDPS